MNEEREKIFVEFSMEGLIEVTDGEKEYVIEQIKHAFADIFDTRNALRMETHVNVITDSDIAFAMSVANGMLAEN
tara:strand:- start:1193 stop:1417 length:225 start_codon:yes stop_codon:yes gene_type:complete